MDIITDKWFDSSCIIEYLEDSTKLKEEEGMFYVKLLLLQWAFCVQIFIGISVNFFRPEP